MSYEIELNQGDTDSIGAVLKENNIEVDLTGSVVTFFMKNESGVEHSIECLQGGIVAGVNYSFAQGGITIPFTTEHTQYADSFQGKLTAVKNSIQRTFPSSNIYISVKIWEAV
jgi:hypothetical protein